MLPQCVLIGPSLVGKKLFLAADVLAQPNVWTPHKAGAALLAPHDVTFSDPPIQFEAFRWFTVSELRAGRLPLWNPYGYCGAPFLAANQPGVFSPLRLLDLIWPSPFELAWRQLLKALVTGIGAYLFFRRAVRVRFAAAAVGAWAWPLTGYFILWAGHPQSEEAVWLPWAMWAVNSVVRRSAGLGGIGVALTTACLLVSGHSSTGGQILLGCGAFFLWRFFERYGLKFAFTRKAGTTVAAVVAGWVLGFMLAAPQMLPTLKYMHESHRMAARVSGPSETPSQGLAALPELVLPYIHGSNDSGSIYLLDGNRCEGAAAGWAGVIIALFFAPLALRSRRHRSLVFFCLAIGTIGMARVLGIPMLARVLDSPPLNTFRNNRLVLLTAWSLVTAGVVGCDQLLRGRRPGSRLWLMAPICLGAWCLMLALRPPALLTGQLAQAREWISSGKRVPAALHDLAGIAHVADQFRATYLVGAAVCFVAASLWIVLWQTRGHRTAIGWGAGILAIAELTLWGYNVYPQCDPSLYFPPIPVLEALAHAPPGRICGVHCLPPRLSERYRLSDIRGYDGADPQRLVELLELFQDEVGGHSPSWAVTQWFQPKPSPLADMLNLRYLIHRGEPSIGEKVMLRDEDYYVVENSACLPRVWVPRQTRVVNDKTQRLQALADPGFDPRQVAFIESDQPIAGDSATGRASIIREDPSHVLVDVKMQTPGTVILADSWDAGWRAFLNGVELPVHRANHVLRAVRVPAGEGILEFRYQPREFSTGMKLCGTAVVLGLIWGVLIAFRASPGK